jgi:hypothetical protein
MKQKTPTRDQLKHLGQSIITIGDGPECLGDLMHFKGRGTYDPTLGLVDVTKEEAEVHNKALDIARLEGMDKNCEIGQGSFAYLCRNMGVTTFIGTKIADYTLNPAQTHVTFCRAGKTYKGRLSSKTDAFNFRRVK